MKAVIIAAGEGKRLKEFYPRTPKPLIPIAGKPLIFRTIDGLKEAGIKEIIVVVGYKSDVVKSAIKNNYRGIEFVENKEWPKGNLYSILAVKEKLEENFLLVMCDHIFDPRIIRSLLTSKIGKNCLILGVEKKIGSPDDTKVLVVDDKIKDIGKSIPNSNFVDIGIFIFTPEIFDYAEKVAENDGSEIAQCIKLVANDNKATIYNISKVEKYVSELRRNINPYWLDVDTPKDISRAKQLLIENSQKGASDFLACYLHQPIENKIVYYLSDLKITPNQVSIFVNVLAYIVTFLYLFGYFLEGVIIAFLVGIVDGVDGKLARVKGQATKVGTMEHPFDMLFEFSWFIAFAINLYKSQGSHIPLLLALFIITFCAFYRHCYDRFRRSFGRSLDDTGNFERFFRRIAGRRNLYNIPIIICVLLKCPIYALYAILIHSFTTAVVYAERSLVHLNKLDKLNKGGLS